MIDKFFSADLSNRHTTVTVTVDYFICFALVLQEDTTYRNFGAVHRLCTECTCGTYVLARKYEQHDDNFHSCTTQSLQ